MMNSHPALMTALEDQLQKGPVTQWAPQPHLYWRSGLGNSLWLEGAVLSIVLCVATSLAPTH